MDLVLRVAHQDRGVNLEIAQFTPVAAAAQGHPRQYYRCAVPKCLNLNSQSLFQVYPSSPLMAVEQVYILLVYRRPDNAAAVEIDHCGTLVSELEPHVYFSPAAAAITTEVWAVATSEPVSLIAEVIKGLLPLL